MDNTQEFERLKAEFRTKRLGMYPQEKDTFLSNEEMISAAKKVKEFCLASGHDLRELNAFFQGVETEYYLQVAK
jgi:hypothetical protein